MLRASPWTYVSKWTTVHSFLAVLVIKPVQNWAISGVFLSCLWMSYGVLCWSRNAYNSCTRIRVVWNSKVHQIRFAGFSYLCLFASGCSCTFLSSGRLRLRGRHPPGLVRLHQRTARWVSLKEVHLAPGQHGFSSPFLRGWVRSDSVQTHRS